MKQVQENVIEQIFQNKSNMRVFYTQNSKKQRFTPTPPDFCGRTPQNLWNQPYFLYQGFSA